MFRDYVETLVAHDGKVEAVPENQVRDDEDSFPPKIEVPKSFIREHERLELEAEHLRDQLQEHKQYVRHLKAKVDEETEEEVIHLEELDDEIESDEPFRLG